MQGLAGLLLAGQSAKVNTRPAAGPILEACKPRICSPGKLARLGRLAAGRLAGLLLGFLDWLGGIANLEGMVRIERWVFDWMVVD